MFQLVNLIFNLLFWGILVWVILSWIQVGPGHPLRTVQDFLTKAITPLLRPIQKLIPPIRMGAGALDLSPIILLLALRLLHGPVLRLVAGF